MKKLLVIALLFSLAACKKKDDGPTIPLDTFTFGGTSYTATEYNQLYWGTGNGNGSGFLLGALNLVAGKTYAITTTRFSSSPDSVSVYFRRRGSGIIGYEDYVLLQGQVIVTNDGGNRLFYVPQAWAKNTQLASDSVQVSAYLKENL